MTTTAGRIPSLEYGRGGRPVRRIHRRHLILAALLVGCALGSWIVGRSARDRVQSALYQRQAARHAEPGNAIVYESDLETAQALVAAGTHVSLSDLSSAPAVLREPDSFSVFRNVIGDNSVEAVGALVFLHELTTPSGARRIVAVQFLPHYLDGRVIPGAGLVTHVFEPGGLMRDPLPLGRSEARLLVPQDEPAPASLEPEAPRGHAGLGLESPILRDAFDPWGTSQQDLRWYAGQPDELDASHFTIDYEIAGVRGTIDGYLSDDGRHVRMHARPHHASTDAHSLTGISLGSIR